MLLKKITDYCYHSVNVITCSLAQCDHIKRLLLYLKNFANHFDKKHVGNSGNSDVTNAWAFVKEEIANESCQRQHLVLITLLVSSGKKCQQMSIDNCQVTFDVAGVDFTNKFTISFFARRSQKRKKKVKLSVSFCAFTRADPESVKRY